MKSNFKFLIVLTILLAGCIWVGSAFASEVSLNDIGDVQDITVSNVDNAQNLEIVHDSNQNTLESNNCNNNDLSKKANKNTKSSRNVDINKLNVNTGTFTDLSALIQDASEGSILNLTCDYQYDTSSDSLLKEGVVINKTLVINGNGHSINGSDLVRIFDVTANNVVIKNIKFLNTNFPSPIYSLSYGGAISWSGDNGNVINCSFVNCSSGTGGAISWDGINGTVKDSIFTNIVAESSGGAISWDGVKGTMSNCTFINTFSSNGGAIHWNGDNGLLSNCTFINTSASGGASIYWRGADSLLINCTFINTSSLNSAGAIHFRNSGNAIRDCTFINTSANANAGAIELYYVYDSIVNNCTFINVSSGVRGGAIYWNHPGGTLTNCTFVNVHANESGGAIYWNYENGVVSGCTFVNTSAKNLGGAISWNEGNGTVSDCSFTNCNASVGGAISWESGAFHWDDSSKGTISNCSFINNSANIGSSIFITKWGRVGIFDSNCIPVDGDDKAPIYNNGTISSDVEITTINGKTKKVANGDIVNLTGIITTTDIRVAGGILNFTVNNTNLSGESDETGLYSVEYVVDFVGTEPVDAYYNNCSAQQSVVKGKLTTDKINVTVDVSADNIKYGDDVTVDVSVNGIDCDSVPTGNVIILVNGKKIANVTLTNGKCNYPISNLPAGKYNLTVIYDGDYNYTATKNSTNFNVAKINPQVTVDICSEESFEIKFGDTVVALVGLPSDATGNLSLSIDNETWTKITLDGKNLVEYDIPDLDAGNYILFVKYSGDNNYNPVYSENPFSINPLKTTVTILPVKGKAGEKVNITVLVTDERGQAVEDGIVIIGFNGKEYMAYVVDGIAIVEVTLPEKAGIYSATAYYEGFNYNSSYEVFTVEVIDVPGPNPDPNPVNPVGNMENTGNPLLVLLIALAAIGLESLRRKF